MVARFNDVVHAICDFPLGYLLVRYRVFILSRMLKLIEQRPVTLYVLSWETTCALRFWKNFHGNEFHEWTCHRAVYSECEPYRADPVVQSNEQGE